MVTVVVSARCNVDRVWHLTMPLRPGGRVSYRSRTERPGGGGYYTGTTLLAFGHAVRLAGTLASDARADRYRADLAGMGFDTAALERRPGCTVPVEVLIDPSGERTVLARETTEHQPVDRLPLDGADLLYVHVRSIDPALMRAAKALMPVVAQVPLQPGERRPCHWLVGSTADLPHLAASDAFAYASAMAGEELEAFVLTDGARPTRIWTQEASCSVLPRRIERVPDSAGAGDVFAAGLIDARLRGLGVVEAVDAGDAAAARFLRERAEANGTAEPAT